MTLSFCASSTQARARESWWEGKKGSRALAVRPGLSGWPELPLPSWTRYVWWWRLGQAGGWTGREQEGKCEGRIVMMKARLLQVSLEPDRKMALRVGSLVGRKEEKERLVKAVSVESSCALWGPWRGKSCPEGLSSSAWAAITDYADGAACDHSNLFSQFQRLRVEIRVPAWLILERARFTFRTADFSCVLVGWRQTGRKPSYGSSEGTSPTARALPSWPHLRLLISPSPSHRGVGFRHMNFGGHKHSICRRAEIKIKPCQLSDQHLCSIWHTQQSWRMLSRRENKVGDILAPAGLLLMPWAHLRLWSTPVSL